MKKIKIAEFKNSAVKVTVVMNACCTNTEECLKHKLYCVTETPQYKNARWEETKKEFDFTEEWKKYFKDCVDYWVN